MKHVAWPAVLVISALFIGYSAVAFLVFFTPSAIFAVSYGMGTLAFLISGGVIVRFFSLRSCMTRQLYSVASVRWSLWYWCIQVILCFLSMGLHEYMPLPVIICVHILALIGYVCLVVPSISAENFMVKHDVLQHSATAPSHFALAYRILISLRDRCPQASTRKALHQLVEAFRYSDPRPSAEVAKEDERLFCEVQRMSDLTDAAQWKDIDLTCATITQKLVARNQICKLTKQNICECPDIPKKISY